MACASYFFLVGSAEALRAEARAKGVDVVTKCEPDTAMRKKVRKPLTQPSSPWSLSHW